MQVLENACARLGCNKYYNKERYRMNQYGVGKDGQEQKAKDKVALDAIRTLDDLDYGLATYVMSALTGKTAGWHSSDNIIKMTPQDIKQIYNETKFATIGFKTNTESIIANHLYSVYDVFERGDKTYITIINPLKRSHNFEDFVKHPGISLMQSKDDKVLTLLIDDAFMKNILAIHCW